MSAGLSPPSLHPLPRCTENVAKLPRWAQLAYLGPFSSPRPGHWLSTQAQPACEWDVPSSAAAGVPAELAPSEFYSLGSKPERPLQAWLGHSGSEEPRSLLDWPWVTASCSDHAGHTPGQCPPPPATGRADVTAYGTPSHA